ncbi:MAG: hypothetical protein AB1650_09900 [Candidatus Omnitrophota bacterium]
MKTSICVNYCKKIFNAAVIAALSFSLILSNTAGYAQPAPGLVMPEPGVMVNASMPFEPALLKGVTLHEENPFEFDFIVDSGNTNFNDEELSLEVEKLIRYFVASVTIPGDSLWVNLSPYEEDRIIAAALGKTELGRDMLTQDYLLKQLTASLIYPETDLGKIFWEKLYKQAYERYGTTELPKDLFNKVWILPDKAEVFEKNNTVYITKSSLKVLSDADYLALRKNTGNSSAGHVNEETRQLSSLSSDIVRELIIPEIEKEINQGENFAPVRQIYNSLILAKWYKEKIKDSLLAETYVDQNKIDGVDLEDDAIKQKVYDQYLLAYEKGVYDYVKDEYDPSSGQFIPRKYFSGGIEGKTIRLEPGEEGMAGESFTGRGFKSKAVLFDGAMLTNNTTRRKFLKIMGISGLAAAFSKLVPWQKITGLFAPLSVFSQTAEGEVTFGWSPNPESTLAGYKLYYGEQSRSYHTSLDIPLTLEGFDPLHPTITLTDNIAWGRQYYFACTAYDVNGFESDFSTEVAVYLSYKLPLLNDIREDYRFNSTNIPADGSSFYVHMDTAIQALTYPSILNGTPVIQTRNRDLTSTYPDYFTATVNNDTNVWFFIAVDSRVTPPGGAVYLGPEYHIQATDRIIFKLYYYPGPAAGGGDIVVPGTAAIDRRAANSFFIAVEAGRHPVAGFFTRPQEVQVEEYIGNGVGRTPFLNSSETIVSPVHPVFYSGSLIKTMKDGATALSDTALVKRDTAFVLFANEPPALPDHIEAQFMGDEYMITTSDGVYDAYLLKFSGEVFPDPVAHFGAVELPVGAGFLLAMDPHSLPMEEFAQAGRRFFAQSKASLAQAASVLTASLAKANEEVGGIDMNDIHVNNFGENANINFNQEHLKVLINIDPKGLTPKVIHSSPIKSAASLFNL